MKVLLVEPFFAGSHRQWAEGLQKESRHDIEILSLPGRHWKWRMFGAAVSLAEKALQLPIDPDLILVSDMLDLTTFLALWQKEGKKRPRVMLYFHENQITYPWSPDDQIVERNEQYGFINFTSALAADVIWFNSDFHRMSFLDALPGFLKKYPDFQSLHRIPEIEKKAHTRWLGLPLQELDIEDKPERTDSPILLWNHRWEYDKDPDTFFRLCFDLADRGHDFRLIVLGEEYKKQPPIFSQARERLASRLLHWGYAKSRSEYARLLWQADILPVSSQQDFFGGSTVEAIYCNNYPILPNRLAFPEHLDLNLHSENLFSDYEELLFKTERALKQVEAIRKYDFYRLFVSRYDWKQLAPVYDRELDKIF